MKLQLINSTQTNNFNDEHMMEKIRTIWEDASRNLDQHQNSVYGVYYQYESDYKGDYSLGVGVEGDGENHIEIPDNQNYEIFKVDTGDELGIVHAWRKIWELEEEGRLNRAYTVDYEKYAPNGEIEIHIAIR